MVHPDFKASRIDAETTAWHVCASGWIPAFLLWTLTSPWWAQWLSRFFGLEFTRTFWVALLFAAVSAVVSVAGGVFCAIVTTVLLREFSKMDSLAVRCYVAVLAFAVYVIAWSGIVS